MSTRGGIPRGFTQIDLNLLQVDTVVNFDIYIWPDQSLSPVLYRDRNLRLDAGHLKRLAEAGPSRVLVREDAVAQLNAYIERNLDKIITSPQLPLSDKAKVLYDTSLKLAIDVLDHPETHKNLVRSQELVKNAISYVLLGKDAFHELLTLKAYDYRTYTHSVNVCTIGLALAEKVGCTSHIELMEFGLGAIFHDVGKTKIPQEVLRKPGPLDEGEWAQVKRHPIIGLELVAPHVDFPGDSRAIILQHHERLDGTGYPVGARNAEIHPYAKIAALADVFDALTSRRPYKDAVDTYPALTIMKEEVGGHFSDDYFKEFVKLMGQ